MAEDGEMRALLVEVRDAALAGTAAANAATNAAKAASEAADTATSAAKRVEAGLHDLRTRTLENHADTNRKLLVMRRDFGHLWKHVRGSKPPPPDGNPAEAALEFPGEESLTDKLDQALDMASHHDLELPALEGRMISAVSGVEAKVEEKVKELKKAHEDSLKEVREQHKQDLDKLGKSVTRSFESQNVVLNKQSEAMGIGIRGVRWLTTSEGRNVALRLATLAGAVYVAFKISAFESAHEAPARQPPPVMWYGPSPVQPPVQPATPPAIPLLPRGQETPPTP